MVWYSHFFNSFLQFIMIHTVRGFGIVDETEVDVFLKFPSILRDPVNVGNLLSGSYSFSKPSLDIWKFLICITLKPTKNTIVQNKYHFYQYPMPIKSTYTCILIIFIKDKSM